MAALKRTPRILLLAEAANPEWVSVPLIGWSLSRALAGIVDAHLVTHVRNRRAIIRAGLVENKDFTALDNEFLARPLYQVAELVRGGAGRGWTTLTAFSALSYYSFEWEFWKSFRRRLEAREFDLVHRITPLSPTCQSLIAKPLNGRSIPFVVGPLNGGIPWPEAFAQRRYAEREWLSHVRKAYKLLPGYRSMHLYSSAVLAGSRHTFQELPRWSKSRRVYIPENGFSTNKFAKRKSPATRPLRVIFLGRLVPYKGADMLLEAAAGFLRSSDITLNICGDGPERHSLEEMVVKLGLQNVTFRGWIEHSQVPAVLAEHDVLVLPSIREFGGGVVIEAMAAGLAVVVADYGGPAELVDASTGMKVPFTDRASLVDGLYRALEQVVSSPDLVDTMGTAARQKAFELFSWDAKARQIALVYQSVIENGAIPAPFPV